MNWERLIEVWNWVAWGGAAVCVALGFFVSRPFFIVAAVIFGAWAITYLVFMALALAVLLLGFLGFEIRRKRS